MSSEAVTLVGSYLSPYVRKVLVFLQIKQIDYVIDPIVPFFGNDAFSRLSPERRIPVFIDEAVTISDCTVICEYLEERYPQPALYPPTPQSKARARLLEDYADTRMGEVFVRRLFNERVIKRVVWGEEADQAVVTNALETLAPQILDYLEHEFSAARPFLFDDLCIADIAIASFMRNACMAGYSIDPERWPAVHAIVERVLQHPGFCALSRFETLSLQTPLAEQRDALIAAGAPIAPHSYGTAMSRRGVLAR